MFSYELLSRQCRGAHERAMTIRKIAKSLQTLVRILCDMQGPKIRIEVSLMMRR